MKVVLLKDVKGVGRAHEVVEAKDGYALNMLIPRKMAVAATLGAVKEAGERIKKVELSRALQHKLIAERVAALAEGHLSFRKKVNEKGHLYDAVDVREIAEAAQLPVEALTLEKPIKEAGTYDIPVVYGESFGKFSIIIEAE